MESKYATKKTRISKPQTEINEINKGFFLLNVTEGLGRVFMKANIKSTMQS